MKVGIVSDGYFEWADFEIGLSQLSQDGYHCYDFHNFIMSDEKIFRLSENQLKEYLNKILIASKKNNVNAGQLHAPWKFKPNLPLETQIDRVYTSIRGAAYLDCPYVVVHPFCIDGGSLTDVFSLNVKTLKNISEYANKYNVTICVENLPFLDYKISEVSEVIKLIDQVDKPNCLMCFDTGHAHVFGDDISEDIFRISDRLRTLHVHDNNGKFDAHMLPWQGTIDWNQFTNTLMKQKFDGCLSLETHIGRNMPYNERRSMQKSLNGIIRKLAGLS